MIHIGGMPLPIYISISAARGDSGAGPPAPGGSGLIGTPIGLLLALTMATGDAPPEGGIDPPFAFPDATNTGSTAGLPLYAGSTNISAPTTIENKHIIGTVTLTAGAVGSIIRNCFIDCTGGYFYGIDADTNNLTVEDCTITGAGTGTACISLTSGTNFLLQRNNCSGFENGIIDGVSGTISRNYIHNLDNTDTGDPHVDGISSLGGANGVTINENTIVSWDTSCIFLKSAFGNVANITINHNLMRKEVGRAMFFPLNCDDDVGGNITGLIVTDNHIQLGDADYVSFDGFSPATFTGNVDADTLAPIV